MQKWIYYYLVKEYKSGKEITSFLIGLEYGFPYHKAIQLIKEFEREYVSKHSRKLQEEDPF